MFSRGIARVAGETFSKFTTRYPINSDHNRKIGSAVPLLFSTLRRTTLECSKGAPLVPLKRSLFTIVTRPNVGRKLGHIGIILPCFGIVCRGTKTKKAAAKRFIKTGKGDLKYGHAGKRHNTSKKTKTVKRRLNRMGILSGTWAKKMKELV